MTLAYHYVLPMNEVASGGKEGPSAVAADTVSTCSGGREWLPSRCS